MARRPEAHERFLHSIFGVMLRLQPLAREQDQRRAMLVKPAFEGFVDRCDLPPPLNSDPLY
jgi:hypothetical protein